VHMVAQSSRESHVILEASYIPKACVVGHQQSLGSTSNMMGAGLGVRSGVIRSGLMELVTPGGFSKVIR